MPGWEGARKDPAYNKVEWRRARLACLKRANWRCEIKLEGVCISAASEADHIHGLANDPHHRFLRAACKPCHAVVTAKQGVNARAGRKSNPRPKRRTAW